MRDETRESHRSADAPAGPEGFFVLDKPAGISSARALDAVKRRLPRGTRVGHAGTLDPFATGVLVVLIGRGATKQAERIMGLGKGYRATLRLGATTATLDPESEPIATPGAQPVDPQRITGALAGFIGVIEQAPPAFSAMKVGGRRAFELARRGDEVVLPPRPVRVDRLTMLRYDWPELEIDLECGRGFYVRSLARDIGVKLGVGAYLTQLRRTHVGPFTASAARDPAQLPDAMLPLDFAGQPRRGC